MRVNMRDARVQLKIDNETINMQDDFDMYLIDSPDIISSPIKAYEIEQYPESNGYNIYPYTTQDGFEYKVSLVYYGEEGTANAKISQLKAKMFDNSQTPMKAKEVELWNKYKGVLIVGYMKSLDGVDSEFDDSSDAWFFDLTIQVSDPTKCNFNYNL